MDNRHKRLSLLSGWSQEKVRDARFLVVGAGALGNEVLKNLALLGAGKIWICDSDRVEESNLCKSILFRFADCGGLKAKLAAKAVSEIDPDIMVTPIVADVCEVGLGVFAAMNMVFGCVDNRLARQTISRACFQTGTPWIDGALEDFNGEMRGFMPPNNPCYDCTLSDYARAELAKRHSCSLFAREREQAGIIPVSPISASIIAALQVQEGIKSICGEKVAWGEKIIYYGAMISLSRIVLSPRKDCPWHSPAIEYRTLEIDKNRPFKGIFTAISQICPELEPGEISLPRDYVYLLECNRCHTTEAIWHTMLNFSAKQGECPECGQMRSPRMTRTIANTDELCDKEIREILPANEIVHVYDRQYRLYRYFLVP